MLGYLPREQYAELLASADVVLALTTREATMQRAAYEALEAGRPIVASDTRVLRESLGDAAEYTAPDGEAIASAVRRALARSDQMVAAMPAVRAAMAAQAQKAVDAVLALRRPAATGLRTPGPQTGSSPCVSLEK
jgi:glycosyltransferase involved in cell wall biosynthesis